MKASCAVAPSQFWDGGEECSYITVCLVDMHVLYMSVQSVVSISTSLILPVSVFQWCRARVQRETDKEESGLCAQSGDNKSDISVSSSWWVRLTPSSGRYPKLETRGQVRFIIKARIICQRSLQAHNSSDPEGSFLRAREEKKSHQGKKNRRRAVQGEILFNKFFILQNLRAKTVAMNFFGLNYLDIAG